MLAETSRRQSRRNLGLLGAREAASRTAVVEVGCPKEAGTWPVAKAVLAYDAQPTDQPSTTEVVAWGLVSPFEPRTCDPDHPRKCLLRQHQLRLRQHLLPWLMHRKAEVDLKSPDGVAAALEVTPTCPHGRERADAPMEVHVAAFLCLCGQRHPLTVPSRNLFSSPDLFPFLVSAARGQREGRPLRGRGDAKAERAVDGRSHRGHPDSRRRCSCACSGTTAATGRRKGT